MTRLCGLAISCLTLLACVQGTEIETLAARECGTSLRFATFNVRFDNPDDGKHAWPKRRDQVVDHIESIAPAVLGTQEGLAHQVEYLQQQLPGYAREGVGRDDGASAGEHAAIFYRRDLFLRLDGGTFWLSETPERPKRAAEAFDWDTQLNRITSWVLLRERSLGQRILVLNAHFDHQSGEAKRKSAQLIQERVAAMDGSYDKIVLLGDLNARPDTEAHAILANNSALSAPHWSLTDAFYLAEEPDVSTTLTRWRFLLPGFHLDHIFVPDDSQVLSYRVHSQKFFYEGARRYTSDHLPVSMELCVD